MNNQNSILTDIERNGRELGVDELDLVSGGGGTIEDASKGISKSMTTHRRSLRGKPDLRKSD